MVKYTVRVYLDSLDEDIFLPLGATANVVIQVKEAASIPNANKRMVNVQ